MMRTLHNPGETCDSRMLIVMVPPRYLRLGCVSAELFQQEPWKFSLVVLSGSAKCRAHGGERSASWSAVFSEALAHTTSKIAATRTTPAARARWGIFLIQSKGIKVLKPCLMRIHWVRQVGLFSRSSSNSHMWPTWTVFRMDLTQRTRSLCYRMLSSLV